MRGLPHHLRVLAETEAEFAASDPQLLELFESFSRDSARAWAQTGPPGARRGQRARRAVLLIAALLAVAFGPGGQAIWDSWGTAGLAGRAATEAQLWVSQQASEVRALIGQSIPAHAAGACG